MMIFFCLIYDLVTVTILTNINCFCGFCTAINLNGKYFKLLYLR